jgi:hypothetical protein
MTYYCFLCNKNYDDTPTKEHFIPRSIDGPEHQWLPVCQTGNIRSNSVFDNDARDILYWVRFQNTGELKRSGEALLCDGTLRRFRFSYCEDSTPERDTAFRYIFDRDANTLIPGKNVYAIAFPVGLDPCEQRTFCRGLAKMSLGAIAYLLGQRVQENQTIRRIFSQTSVNAVRHFALDLPWPGEAVAMRFSLGRSDVLERLQYSCKNQQIRNHVVEIIPQEDSIHVEGMLYSQYGWRFCLKNRVSVQEGELGLENPINHMSAPESLRDLTLSPDAICIVNPDFTGHKPNIPQHWRNS